MNKFIPDSNVRILPLEQGHIDDHLNGLINEFERKLGEAVKKRVCSITQEM
jgi:hypothetical protein